MAKAEEDALKEIECPVCFENMSPPIMLCRTGHNLCSKCMIKIYNCPMCQEKFVANNITLEKIARNIKSIRDDSPHVGNQQSPFDLIDKYWTKNMIANKISQIILTEVKCQDCMKYTMSPIFFCINGHNTCKECKKCTKCNGPVTKGRNFALETIARSCEYPCPYEKFGCSCIFKLPHTEHEDICEYKPITCPLSGTEVIECQYHGSGEDLKHHLVNEHVACTLCEDPDVTLNLKYTSSTVIFALSRIFVISIVIKNGAVFYRLHLVGPPNDTIKFKCKHVFKQDNQVIHTEVLSPSPEWMEFSGSVFLDCLDSILILKVEIHKAESSS